MTLIRKNISFARTTNAASFFKVDGHLLPGASDLDFYLFNREARMDEAWGSERVARLRSELVHPEPSVPSKAATV